LVESLQRFRLLEAHQLEELTGSLQAKFPEPQALAAELVRRSWLTSFQSKQLLQGTWGIEIERDWILSARRAEG